MGMELIVRTAHGVADVIVDVHDPDATLRELISSITGQAAPGAALVDGRTVDTDQPLVEAGLLAGSIVDTDLAQTPRTTPVEATLLQLTGPGAGAIRPLETGTYRIGPGRRLHADELAFSDVETAAFDLDIRESGPAVVTPNAHVALAGRHMTQPVEWSDGLLTAGSRIFALESGDTSPEAMPNNATIGAAGAADRDGRVVYNRPPGHVEGRRLLVVDALRDAVERRPGLWHRRLDADSAQTIDVGANAQTGERATIDLRMDNVVAITGDRTTTTAHARAQLIDAVTSYGPSDLAVVIATTPQHLGAWDWAKWLPHTSVDGPTALLSDELDLAVFALEHQSEPPRQTVLVVTDSRLWVTPDAPLRQLVLHPPPNIAIVVLTTHQSGAPANCQSLIDLGGPDGRHGKAQLVRLAGGGSSTEILVPLTDTRTAVDVARHLARLRDPDLGAIDSAAMPRNGPATIAELVGFHDPELTDAPTAHWSGDVGVGTPAAMPIGIMANAPTTIDLGTNLGVVVSGSSLEEAADVVRTLALSMATAWSPNELAIIAVDHRSVQPDDPIRRLPHFGGTFSDRGVTAGRQFTDRLSSEMSGEMPARSRLAVIVNQPLESELAVPGLAGALTMLAATTPGFHLILVTDSPIASLADEVRGACPFEITVDRVGGVRRGLVHDRVSRVQTPFTPFTPQTSIANSIDIYPNVFGRQTTVLERRLERRVPVDATSPAAERAIERLVDDITALAARRHIGPVPMFVPHLLPDEVSTRYLFDEYRGETIPLGLIDDEHVGEPVPYWWEIGPNASRVAIGSPRAGLRTALDTIIHGVVARFSPDDVHLYVIDPSETRREAMARFAHVGAVASPRDDDEVNRLMSLLIDVLGERTNAPPDDETEPPTIVVVIRDLDRLPTTARAHVQTLLDDGAAVRIHVVATASSPAEVAGLTERFAEVIVGGLSERSDSEMLGILDPAALDRHLGRCVLLPGQQLLQLATMAGSLESTLLGVEVVPATARPPRRPTTPVGDRA